MLPLGPCGWHILRSIYSEEILMIRRKYITICNPSPSPFVRIKEGDCFLSRLCLCWSPIWVLNCWEGEDEQKTVRAEWMCKSRECVWSVQVRNLPQPSFPAEHSLYMRVRECAWGYSQRALVQLVRFVSRSWLKRRGNSENITKRTFFFVIPSNKKGISFFGYRAVEKSRQEERTLGYSKFSEDGYWLWGDCHDAHKRKHDEEGEIVGFVSLYCLGHTQRLNLCPFLLALKTFPLKFTSEISASVTSRTRKMWRAT